MVELILILYWHACQVTVIGGHSGCALCNLRHIKQASWTPFMSNFMSSRHHNDFTSSEQHKHYWGSFQFHTKQQWTAYCRKTMQRCAQLPLKIAAKSQVWCRVYGITNLLPISTLGLFSHHQHHSLLISTSSVLNTVTALLDKSPTHTTNTAHY